MNAERARNGRCNERTRVTTCVNKFLFQELENSPLVILFRNSLVVFLTDSTTFRIVCKCAIANNLFQIRFCSTLKGVDNTCSCIKDNLLVLFRADSVLPMEGRYWRILPTTFEKPNQPVCSVTVYMRCLFCVGTYTLCNCSSQNGCL